MGFLKFCDDFLKRQMGYLSDRLVGGVVSWFSVVSLHSLSVSSVGSLARTSLFLIEWLFLVAIRVGALNIRFSFGSF